MTNKPLQRLLLLIFLSAWGGFTFASLSGGTNYTAFGEIHGQSGGTDNTFLFTGEQFATFLVVLVEWQGQWLTFLLEQ